ncbi:diaminobutyrate--2-oxoglutarate transaminase [Massilia sp. BJB1822]|uniref:diaminobutyrate--2-oxoglutarate transaminase n=1 Tax=Massilia sp. BJB1822 TaxID=2744470 RepID=UPI0015944746|nr:diaminobutyrate--2-oxoglutarate transaminase [Massilia sp. BJB1822]NVE01792.1 diaminobutyrate--2-oxoglutarate transaminase [Massilia sp. BJB1822]
MQEFTESDVIERFESNVRIYCRGFPAVLASASGSLIRDNQGKEYIDFLTAAGSLNYGHNHPALKQAVIDYLAADGITQTLDFTSTAKVDFIRDFNQKILQPREMDYKMQFTGPTGANSVEAAIKLARKVTGRRPIAAFTNAFHGVSLGALALTGNRSKREAAGVALGDVIRLPFDGYMGEGGSTLDYIRKLFRDPSSGIDLPAAFIVETIQGEGGVNCASVEWLQGLSALASELDALLIVDDIQAGCGRSGSFFSFESMGIRPDLICLSKSISGLGLPMAMLLIDRRLDVWAPGEHNGTFRGGNLSFVAATAALAFWQEREFVSGLATRIERLSGGVADIVGSLPPHVARCKGRGMLMGIEFSEAAQAERTRIMAAERGLLIETSGAHDQVVKLMPALNVPLPLLEQGLRALAQAVRAS